jgi:hypothetical protein
MKLHFETDIMANGMVSTIETDEDRQIGKMVYKGHIIILKYKNGELFLSIDKIIDCDSSINIYLEKSDNINSYHKIFVPERLLHIMMTEFERIMINKK